MIYRSMAILPIALIISIQAAQPLAWDQQPDAVMASRINEAGISDYEIKMAFKTAPANMKDIVEQLKHNHENKYRMAIFYGPPGTGKTTLAYGVARYANWDPKYYTPGDFQKGHRGEAAKNFREEMDTITSSNAETVVILDEANGLWEHTESANHDNAETTKAMWLWMNTLPQHKKTFLILVANRIDKSPVQIKSRTIDCGFKVQMPIAIDDRYATFKNILTFNNMKADTASETEIKGMLKDNPRWTARDYEGIIHRISVYNRVNKTTGINPTMLKTIAAERKQSEKDCNYYHRELSDGERQELHHRQNQWVQVLMQRLQKFSLFGLRTPGINSDVGNFIMDRVATEDQKLLAEEFLNEDALRQTYIVDMSPTEKK